MEVVSYWHVYVNAVLVTLSQVDLGESRKSLSVGIYVNLPPCCFWYLNDYENRAHPVPQAMGVLDEPSLLV